MISPSGIAVAVDGSAVSTAAVQWAAREAAHRRVALTVVHVCEVNSAYLWALPHLPEQLKELSRPMVTEAMELAREAVEGRLAACAQVAGPITSMYWWEDGIERAEEWLLMLKLPAAGYQALADFLTRRHSYDEPEIVATPIVAGSAAYLSWITEETRQK